MEEKMAREMMPIYAGEEDPVKVYKPKDSAKHSDDEWMPSKWEIFRERLFEWYHFYSPWGRRVDRWGDKLERFKKRYGILLIAAAVFTIYTIILSASVESRTEKRVWSEARAEYAAQLEAYKAEQAEAAQREHWLSGDASLEAQINRDAEDLCREAVVWKSEKAIYSSWGCVIARMMNPQYPDSIRAVLEQKGAFDYYSSDTKVDSGLFQKAVEFMRAYYNGMIPADLTQNHVIIEMRDGGNDCVVHSVFGGGAGDDPWRYHG